jgi:hypothetical protein
MTSFVLGRWRAVAIVILCGATAAARVPAGDPAESGAKVSGGEVTLESPESPRVAPTEVGLRPGLLSDDALVRTAGPAVDISAARDYPLGNTPTLIRLLRPGDIDPDVEQGQTTLQVFPLLESREGSFRVYDFESPARFPIPRFAPGGAMEEQDGALIYEGMRFVATPAGSYEVRFVVSTPAMPVTLRLQVVLEYDKRTMWDRRHRPNANPGESQLQLREGLEAPSRFRLREALETPRMGPPFGYPATAPGFRPPAGTVFRVITLPPIIMPPYRNTRGQFEAATWQVRQVGHSAFLNLYGLDWLSVDRQGTARFGSYPTEESSPN